MTQQPPPQHGQHPPQYGQPPQFVPPKKKFPKWIMIAGVVVVILIVVAVSGGGDKDKDDSSSSGDSASSQSAEDNGAALGSEVRDGKFGFVVTNVDIGQTTVGDNEYLEKDAQGQFVLVRLDVTNTSDEPQTYFGQNQKLFDTQGREFSNDWEAEINVNEPGSLSAEINPGNKISVTVVFDIPKDAVPASIELHDSAFSGGAKASLR